MTDYVANGDENDTLDAGDGGGVFDAGAGNDWITARGNISGLSLPDPGDWMLA
jgi:Ca2+-binding RTX toxin-like protein